MQPLQPGSTGAAVQALQLALSRAGFSIQIDGDYGPKTQQAVSAFQRAADLSPTGIADDSTIRRLLPYLRGYVIHTLTDPDTFYLLAQTYSTTVEAIETANPGLNPSNLPVGQRIFIPLGFSLVPTQIAYTSALLALIVEGLSVRYPFLRVGRAGQSTLGRPLYTLSLGRGEKEVFYNASHHANEWITTPVLLQFVEQYSQAYAQDGTLFSVSARTLYRETTLYAMPMVNPDGVDLVTGAIGSGQQAYDNARALAADYPDIPFPSGWKANIMGVDLNLNYPAGWENAKEIKFAQGFTSPGPRDFVGTGPLSETESRAVYDFTRAHNFLLTLSYHSQGEVIYWKYLDHLPENSYEIARIFGRVSGYAVEQTPVASGYAGYKDWFILEYNRPGCTIEVGLGESPLPLSQFPRIYADNLGILTLGMLVI